MTRWTNHLALFAAAIGLAAFISPRVDATPPLKPASKPKIPTPVVVNSKLMQIKPGEILNKESQVTPVKVKLTPSKRLQEVIAERTNNAIIARGIGTRTTLAPRTMYLNQKTFMRTHGEISVSPSVGKTGVIRMMRRSEWIDYYGMTDFVAVRFRAAANQHYVVDCHVGGENVELYLARGNDWIGSKGTHEGDHRIAHLPKSSTHRDIIAYVFNMTETKEWGEVHQCEIIPLRE